MKSTYKNLKDSSNKLKTMGALAGSQVSSGKVVASLPMEGAVGRGGQVQKTSVCLQTLQVTHKVQALSTQKQHDHSLHGLTYHCIINLILHNTIRT